MYYARKITVNNETKLQTLKEHIFGVVYNVRNYEKPKLLSNIAMLCALTHDCGKGNNLWQEYLLKDGRAKGKKIPHSDAGMKLIDFLENDINETTSFSVYDKYFKEIPQYVVGAHHGLYDAMSIDGRYITKDKINNSNRNTYIQESIENYFADFSIDELREIYQNALEDFNGIINIINESGEGNRIHYHMGVVTRMLLSMVIDGDWSDAANFESEIPVFKDYSNDDKLWSVLADSLENYILDFSANTDLNKERQRISDECFKSSLKDCGIYKLNVPTGGGKTIAGMRFALNHAKIHNKSRIFYIAPYMSILEQNSEEYRRIFSSAVEDIDSILLEHHSNIVFETEIDQDDDEYSLNEDELKRYNNYRILSSNWSAPLIMTTFVQFLNTLFSNNKASIRRMHNLSNSIVIIDEVQSLPIEILTPFNLMINALSLLFDVTFVLATATQPPFDEILGKQGEDKIAKINYSVNENLVDNINYKVFKRAELIHGELKPLELEELTDFVIDKVEDTKSLLVILNTKSAVKKLYDNLKMRTNEKVYYLTTNLAAAHRKEKLDEIKERIKSEKLILISTNLIQAGVDISFSTVIRSITGLDSLIQTIGRCNRNAESANGSVYLVVTKDLENIDSMETMKIAANISEAKFLDFKENPGRYNYDMTSVTALREYFLSYYNNLAKKSHYYIKDLDSTIYNLLGQNSVGVRANKKSRNPEAYVHLINQGFLSAGKYFKAIDTYGTSVIVPWKDGKDIIAKIYANCNNPIELQRLISRAQRFTVNISDGMKMELEKIKALRLISNELNIYVLEEGYYSEDVGIVEERAELELNIF